MFLVLYCADGLPFCYIVKGHLIVLLTLRARVEVKVAQKMVMLMLRGQIGSIKPRLRYLVWSRPYVCYAFYVIVCSVYPETMFICVCKGTIINVC